MKKKIISGWQNVDDISQPARSTTYVASLLCRRTVSQRASQQQTTFNWFRLCISWSNFHDSIVLVKLCLWPHKFSSIQREYYVNQIDRIIHSVCVCLLFGMADLIWPQQLEQLIRILAHSKASRFFYTCHSVINSTVQILLVGMGFSNQLCTNENWSIACSPP